MICDQTSHHMSQNSVIYGPFRQPVRQRLPEYITADSHIRTLYKKSRTDTLGHHSTATDYNQHATQRSDT